LKDFADRGVTVRRADFDEPAFLPEAFCGVERILIIGSDAFPMEKRRSQQKAAIEAAVKAGAKHIIVTAMPGLDSVDDGNPWTQGSRHVLQALENSGVTWTALCMNIWADGVAYFFNALRTGSTLLVPEGSGKPCWVTHEDYARTAASVLAGKAPISGIVNVTGPESLGLEELAQRWSGLHGKKLDAVILPGAEVVERLASAGVALQQVQGIVNYCGLFRMFEVSVSDIVERATGTPPASVDGILKGA
jgi:NAD(P)H dehydrogenase (quinone)